MNTKKYIILSNNRKYFKVYHIKNIEVGEIKEFDISNRNVVIKIEVTIEFDRKKTMNCEEFVILALCVLTSISVLFRLADKKRTK